MEKYIIMGVIGIIVLIIIVSLFNMYFQLLSHKVIVKWDEIHAEKKKEKEEKANKKLAEKYCKIYVGNPYLEAILKQYNIIVFGPLGAGKTLFANLLCNYLNKKYQKEDKKNRRYNHYMLPEYEQDLKNLKNNKLLRVYSNTPLIDEDGKRSQEVWPFLTQEKRFIERGIVFTDEFGTNLGKDLWFSDDKNSIQVERIVDMSRFARQNCDVKWIGTEQNKDNIFKPIRDRGFTEVEALKTFAGLSKWGKFKRVIVSGWRFFMPGLLCLNIRKLYQKTLFKQDKIALFFKLLLPSYFLIPREYYISKTNFSSKLKKKHMKYVVLINFYGHEMLFKFGNKDIFAYNTRQNKAKYLKQFDKEGNRIYE